MPTVLSAFDGFLFALLEERRLRALISRRRVSPGLRRRHEEAIERRDEAASRLVYAIGGVDAP